MQSVALVLSNPLTHTTLFADFLETGNHILIYTSEIASDFDFRQSEELLQGVGSDFKVFPDEQSTAELLTPAIKSSLATGHYNVNKMLVKCSDRDTDKSLSLLAYKKSLLLSPGYHVSLVLLATVQFIKCDHFIEDASMLRTCNDPCPRATFVEIVGALRDQCLQHDVCILAPFWFDTGQLIILAGKNGSGQCLVEFSVTGLKYLCTIITAACPITSRNRAFYKSKEYEKRNGVLASKLCG